MNPYFDSLPKDRRDKAIELYRWVCLTAGDGLIPCIERSYRKQWAAAEDLILAGVVDRMPGGEKCLLIPRRVPNPRSLWISKRFGTSILLPNTERDMRRPTAVDARAEPTASLGYLSPTEIATAIGAKDKANTIGKYLKRLFDGGRLPDSAWMENNNPAKGQAKILYKLSAVRPFLARLESGNVG